MNASLGALRRPIRIVLRWQLIASAALTLAGGLLAGVDGALSAALNTLLADSALRARLGEGGARRVKEEFDVGRMVARTLATYNGTGP